MLFMTDINKDTFYICELYIKRLKMGFISAVYKLMIQIMETNKEQM